MIPLTSGVLSSALPFENAYAGATTARAALLPPTRELATSRGVHSALDLLMVRLPSIGLRLSLGRTTWGRPGLR